MNGHCVIYGASGFTGRQLVEEARRRSIPVVLAGRSRARLQRVVEALSSSGLDQRQLCTASLDDPRALDEMLDGAAVLLNAAGPYAVTAMPLVEACLRTRTHYLDVSGELPVIERIAGRDADATRAAVMLMPAAGYAVVPTDSLALRAARLVPDAVNLRIGLSHFELFAAGSAKSMVALVRNEVRVRREHAMTNVGVGELERDFDYGAGPSRSTAINWCDAFTAHFATGIPNIEVYLEAGALQRLLYRVSSLNSGWIGQPVVQALLGTAADIWLADRDPARVGAALSQRQRCLVVEVTNRAGNGVQLRLTSPDPYRVTRECAIEIVRRVLAGSWRSGFRTPAAVYGDDLLQGLSGIRIERRSL